jgi:hypothetical protein
LVLCYSRKKFKLIDAMMARLSVSSVAAKYGDIGANPIGLVLRIGHV